MGQETEGQAGGDGGTGDAGQASEQGKQQEQKAPEAGRPAQQDAQQSGKVEDLPEWAQKLIRDTRAEAAASRTSAKATAAEEAQRAIVDKISEALGLRQGEQVSPEQLQKQLSEAISKHRSTLVELAVLKAAPKAGANPEALLDSRAFLARVKDLDPSADGFGDQVGEAIKAAVEANPRLAAQSTTSTASKTGGEINGGSGDQGGSGDSWEDIEKLVRGARGR